MQIIHVYVILVLTSLCPDALKYFWTKAIIANKKNNCLLLEPDKRSRTIRRYHFSIKCIVYRHNISFHAPNSSLSIPTWSSYLSPSPAHETCKNTQMATGKISSVTLCGKTFGNHHFNSLHFLPRCKRTSKQLQYIIGIEDVIHIW